MVFRARGGNVGAGLVTASACLLLTVATAHAQRLVFDFDTDGDPNTVTSEVQAEAGDVVQAFLVVQGFPTPWEFLGGLQFGIDSTDGLELAGILSVGERGGFLHDGTDGIAYAFYEEVARDALPMFVMSLTFVVTSEEMQEVRIAPSTGWGHVYEGVLYAVGDGSGPAGYLVEDVGSIENQGPGIVNRGGMLPVQETTWGAIKKLFSDDTL